MEARREEGQRETGPGGAARPPYLLVDASLAGAVH